MRLRQVSRRVLPVVISALMLLTGATSCQKEKKESPEPANPTQHLKEYREGSDFIRFEYSASGIVSKITMRDEMLTNDNTIDYTVEYNDESRISALRSSAGEDIVPVYENGQLIRADIMEGATKTGYTAYQFENGLMKRATIYWGSGTDFGSYLEFIFSYDNNANPIETVLMMSMQHPDHLDRFGHIEAEYDQHSNPLYEHKDLLTLLLKATPKNNITRADQFDSGLNLEDSHLYTYTYQANGLPGQANVKTGLPGQPETNRQIVYIYQ